MNIGIIVEVVHKFSLLSTKGEEMIKTLFLLVVLVFSQQVSAMTFLSGEELVTVKVSSGGRLLSLSTRKSILEAVGIKDSSQILTEEQGNKIIDQEEKIAEENKRKAAER